MPTADRASIDLRLLATVGLVVVMIVVTAAWYAARRRATRSFPHRLRQAYQDMLTGVLLPDAEGGQIHIEYLVRTHHEIIVVDYRDVAGHVFGSEGMQEWTVLGRKRRTTFPNPLPALYDRVAAVRRIASGVPVRGVVAFSVRAQFSKGFPPNVVMVDALLAESPSRGSPEPDATLADAVRAGWDTLRAQIRQG